MINETRTLMLIVKNVTKNDEGDYFCEVENSCGKKIGYSSYNLIVHGKIDLSLNSPIEF